MVLQAAGPPTNNEEFDAEFEINAWAKENVDALEREEVVQHVYRRDFKREEVKKCVANLIIGRQQGLRNSL